MTAEMVLSILAAAGPYVAVCAVTAAGLYLTRTRDRESARGMEGINLRVELAERRLQAAEIALAHIKSQMTDLEEQARLSSGAPAKSWTNINRRTQAVRMLRAGDRPSQVATELSMSRAEVELIRRVQSLTSQESSIFPVGS
jgi:hypothetical protein